MVAAIEKERGMFLTILLLLFWVEIFLDILHPENIGKIPSNDYIYIKYIPVWNSYFLYTRLILNIVQTYGLWTLKKWAIYLFLFSIIVVTIEMFITLTPDGIKFALLAYVPLQGLFGYAIYRKRKSFD